MKPFLNQEEYQRTENIVKNFENGIGKELHQKLLERAKTRRNWVRILNYDSLHIYLQKVGCSGCNLAI